jgi:hypothetical protein
MTLANEWLVGKRQQRFASPLSKDEVRCGQCFRNFEKFQLLRHSLATCRFEATDNRPEVAFLNKGSTAQSVQPIQTDVRALTRKDWVPWPLL